MVRPRIFGAKLWARMPPAYVAALKVFTFQFDVPLAEYVRDMVHDHILERGGAFRERGGALRALINSGKAYQEGVPVSEYVREMVHEHILQRVARFRETGARLRTLSNAVKTWLIAYHECETVAAGRLGKERKTPYCISTVGPSCPG